jgi:hypothetical protein
MPRKRKDSAPLLTLSKAEWKRRQKNIRARQAQAQARKLKRK